MSRLRKRLPTRCQKRYARWGRPPERREPKTTSATPRSIGSISGGHVGRVVLDVGVLDDGDVAVDVRDRRADRRALAPVLLADDDDVSRLAATPRRSRAVPSVEPSSTTMICLSSGSASTRSSTARIVAASLYAGIRKETLGTRGVYGPGRFAFGAITILVAVFAIVGLALRVWILASPMGALDSDEAISGLIARHMLDGEVSALYWLGNYGGTLESAVAAAVFAAVGSSVLALKLTTLGALRRCRCSHLARRHPYCRGRTPQRSARRCFGSARRTSFGGRRRHAPSTRWGSFLACSSCCSRCVFVSHGSRRDAAAFGLVLGLGWWTSPGVVVLALPALVGFCGGGRVWCGSCPSRCRASSSGSRRGWHGTCATAGFRLTSHQSPPSRARSSTES